VSRLERGVTFESKKSNKMNVVMRAPASSRVLFSQAVPSNGTEKTQPAQNEAQKRTLETVQAMSVLSPSECLELLDCERVIERGWQTFVEVGVALARIRDARLYRAAHDTFEAYCREKWHYGKSHVYRLIGAAEVVGHLSPIGDIQPPTREAQVRPLIGLPQADAQAAWREAVKRAAGGVVTEKQVREVVKDTIDNVVRPTTGARRSVRPSRDLGTALDVLKQVKNAIRNKEGTQRVLDLLDKLAECLKCRADSTASRGERQDKISNRKG